MLTDIYTTNQPLFQSLAEAWHSDGAAMFGLWEGDKKIFQYPANTQAQPADLAASIEVWGAVTGQLRLGGLDGAQAQARLNADAQLISQLVTLNKDLETTIAELVSVQDQQLALYDLTRAKSKSLTLDQTLTTLIEKTRQITKADGAFVCLQSDNQEEKQITLYQSDGLNEPVNLLSNLCRAPLAEQKEAVLHAEQLAEFNFPAGNVLSFIPIPITQSGAATMGLLFSQSTAALSPTLKLARAIAEHIGAQIEVSLRHQEQVEQAKLKTELAMAGKIQLQLLPQKAPSIAGLNLAARCVPALQAGGDFFDFIPHDDGTLTFVAGDVAGKGISSALVMAMTRTAIRSKIITAPAASPAEILDYTNTVMYDDFTDVGMFVTLFVGQYYPQRRRITYANAGHSPVIHHSVGGSAVLLEADGPALGVLPMNLSENVVIPFGPDDLIVAATDGFSEARNPAGQMFGYKPLLKLVESLAARRADQIVAQMFKTIHHFSADSPQDDDETLVVVKGTA